MKLVKERAGKKNTKYIRPHKEILRLPGVDGVRVFAFGPPHDADLIADEDPQGDEAFPGRDVSRLSFLAATAAKSMGATNGLPFTRRFAIPKSLAFTHDEYGEFFRTHYGDPKEAPPDDKHCDECATTAAWRRIETDWLYSADEMALTLNKGINNTSLVLAFELEKSGKVLLFAGDAQRGNWKSWADGSWKDDKDKDKVITVRDLMSRTVLYKVGHHGSHNATLKGTPDDKYPNLGWMGQGKYANEFTAMITAVKNWAYKVPQPPWRHPLPSIKKALLDKANGRVLQIDTPTLQQPPNVSDADWKDFTDRVTFGPDGMYFEYQIHDK
jgi:hypothetical protein